MAQRLACMILLGIRSYSRSTCAARACGTPCPPLLSCQQGNSYTMQLRPPGSLHKQHRLPMAFQKLGCRRVIWLADSFFFSGHTAHADGILVRGRLKTDILANRAEDSCRNKASGCMGGPLEVLWRGCRGLRRSHSLLASSRRSGQAKRTSGMAADAVASGNEARVPRGPPPPSLPSGKGESRGTAPSM